MKYNHTFLLKAAIRFEQKAREIIFNVSSRYALLALVGSAFARELVEVLVRHQQIPLVQLVFDPVVLITTLAALATGIFVGRNRAFLLRVEAHKLLALVELTEVNRPKEVETQEAQ